MDKNYAFLGTGWSFPPSFGKKGGYVQMVSGLNDVDQSVKIIASTSPGERVMRHDFGCELSGFAFLNLTSETISDIQKVVSDAIGYHEHRVKMEDVNITLDDKDQGLIYISVDYMVTEDNSRYNMVFPYYLHEADSLDF